MSPEPGLSICPGLSYLSPPAKGTACREELIWLPRHLGGHTKSPRESSGRLQVEGAGGPRSRGNGRCGAEGLGPAQSWEEAWSARPARPRPRGPGPAPGAPRPRPTGLLGEVTSQRDGGGSFRQLKGDLGPEDPSPSAAGRGQAGSAGAGAAAAALGLSHPPRIEALGAAG